MQAEQERLCDKVQELLGAQADIRFHKKRNRRTGEKRIKMRYDKFKPGEVFIAMLVAAILTVLILKAII